jgi:hypothetical protein
MPAEPQDEAPLTLTVREGHPVQLSGRQLADMTPAELARHYKVGRGSGEAAHPHCNCSCKQPCPSMHVEVMPLQISEHWVAGVPSPAGVRERAGGDPGGKRQPHGAAHAGKHAGRCTMLGWASHRHPLTSAVRQIRHPQRSCAAHLLVVPLARPCSGRRTACAAWLTRCACWRRVPRTATPRAPSTLRSRRWAAL